MWMAHRGVDHQRSLSELLSLLQTDLPENPFLLQAQPQRHWAASSLRLPGGSGTASSRGSVLESRVPGEGSGLSRGCRGPGPPPVPPGSELGARRGREGDVGHSTPATSVRSRCTVSSHCGADGREQVEQTKAVSNGAEIKRTSPPLPSLHQPGEVAGRGARAWGGEQEAGGSQVFSGPPRGSGSEGGTQAGGGGPRQASLERPHEVELLPVLAGEDGGLFVVLHQLVHGGEPPLPDAVDAVHELHLEVFVLP